MRVLYDEGEKGDLLLVHPKTHGDTSYLEAWF